MSATSEQVLRFVTGNGGVQEEGFKSDLLLSTDYQRCLNLSSFEELGVDPLKETLVKTGGWPILEGNAWSNTWDSTAKTEYNWYLSLIHI